MKPLYLASAGALLLLVVAVFRDPRMLAWQAPSGTPSAASPRTAWGDPDLQGVWRYEGAIPLERPESAGEKAELSAEDVARRAAVERELQAKKTAGAEGVEVGRRPLTESPIRDNEYNSTWQDHGRPRQVSSRTSLIVDPADGRIPFTPEARKAEDRARARYGVGPYNSYVDPDTGERCLTDGVTALMWQGPNGGHNRIVQSPGYVTILHEEYRDRRVIPIGDRPHRGVRQWFGDARGHWEDETLVVDTTHFIDRTRYEWASVWTRPSETLHLVERYTRADAETIDYQITITDPTTFAKPWTVRIPITRLPAETEIYEYACHEGNYAMLNLLRGARAQERAAASRAGR
jgi:hypothetical protein